MLLSCVKTWAGAWPWGGFERWGGRETKAQSLHLKKKKKKKKKREVCPFCFAKTSPPLYSISSPRVETGWADSGSEILWHFPSLLQPRIFQAQRGMLGSLSRSPSERMINRQSPGPSPVEQQAGSSAGNKGQILSPKHCRGYNEACTKQTGESRPDKQFHFQSSTESEIASLSPAATYRCWTQRSRD